VAAALASLMAQGAAIAKAGPHLDEFDRRERLLDCYHGFMIAKRVNLKTDEARAQRLDAAAKVRCRRAYRSLQRMIGPRETRAAWRELRLEILSRD